MSKPTNVRKKKASAEPFSEVAPPLPIRDPNAPHYTLAELAMHARGCKSFGEAMVKCASLAGFDVKAAQVIAGMDKSRWSRIASGLEGIYWGQVEYAIKVCGNSLPLVWIGQQLEYDPLSFRMAETATERRARLAEEKVQSLELKFRVLAEQRAEEQLAIGRKLAEQVAA